MSFYIPPLWISVSDYGRCTDAQSKASKMTHVVEMWPIFARHQPLFGDYAMFTKVQDLYDNEDGEYQTGIDTLRPLGWQEEKIHGSSVC